MAAVGGLHRAGRPGNVARMLPTSDVFVTGGTSMLRAARVHGYTIPALSVRSLVIAEALVKASVNLRLPQMVEIAASEGDMQGGYTGIPIERLFDEIVLMNLRAGNAGEHALPVVVHRDHNTVKVSGDIGKAVELGIRGIESGVTSMSIDGSHHGNPDDVAYTASIAIVVARGILQKFPPWYVRWLGLEMEVRDVGSPTISTQAEIEAFGDRLAAAGYGSSAIAYHSGTKHGNFPVDPAEVAQALSNAQAAVLALNARGVSIFGGVQHGTTGVPASTMALFPGHLVVKANLATIFQNILFGSEMDEHGAAVERAVSQTDTKGKPGKWYTKRPDAGISDELWAAMETEAFARKWFGNDVKNLHRPFGPAIRAEYESNKQVRDRIDREIGEWLEKFARALNYMGQADHLRAVIEEDVTTGMYAEGGDFTPAALGAREGADD